MDPVSTLLLLDRHVRDLGTLSAMGMGIGSASVERVCLVFCCMNEHGECSSHIVGASFLALKVYFRLDGCSLVFSVDGCLLVRRAD